MRSLWKNLEAESISGDVSISVTAPWIRGRTGQGRLTMGGQAAEVNASTINGAIDLTTMGLERARVSADWWISRSPAACVARNRPVR